jgi:thiol-disulfide isomerase/thioredoxin
MKKYRLLGCLFFAGTLSLSAQTVLRGKISNISASALPVAIMDYWNVDQWKQLAILQLEGGTFSTTSTLTKPTQCRIRLASQAGVWSDFIVGSPGDSLLEFDLDNKTMKGGPAKLPNSPENQRYFNLMSEYLKLKQLRDSMAGKFNLQVQEAQAAFNQSCTKMIKQYPGTYTGDVVANLFFTPLKSDYPNDPNIKNLSDTAFERAHALDRVPFRYAGALQHSGFFVALQRYFSFFDLKAPNGGKDFVEGVMSKRSGNEEVDLFVFKYLLDKLVDFKDEAGLNHLLTWYLPDCSDESPLPNQTLSLVQALQHCQPGKIIEDMKFVSLLGDSVAISEVCAKNKITLLYFWRSNCSHCKEFKPKLIEIYEKFHPQGVEVLAISLENTEIAWKENLQKEPSKFVHAFARSDRRKEINRTFPIPSTPTLIALDRQRKVLSRLILRAELENYLRETLPQMKE